MEPLMLTPELLNEFKLRRASLDTARNNYLMIQESYQAWVTNTLKKSYKIRGRADIDLSSGTITLLSSDNGHAR